MPSDKNSRADDELSVTGGFYEDAPLPESGPREPSGHGGDRGGPSGSRESPGRGGVRSGASGVAQEGVIRQAPPVRRGYGKGPVAVDPRKFRYDLTRGRVMTPVSYGASKADRLDAVEAGDLLDKLHHVLGIDNEPENVLIAFDRALFFEHTINGASLLQPGRGVLNVGQSAFELAPIKQLLGVDQRRFFRAFADDISMVNREILEAYDPHDAVASERYGQLMQVAVERGLQKYPYLAHDSSDAGVRLSVEERVALMGSKRVVLESTVNNADKLPVRAAQGDQPQRM